MKGKMEITHANTPRLKTTLKIQSGAARKMLDKYKCAYVITDRATADAYPDFTSDECTYIIEDSRGADFGNIGKILDFLKERGCSRDSDIIAFGDDSVNNVAGLTAAAFMWGVSWHIIPTTLTAMVNAPSAGRLNLFSGSTPSGLYYPPVSVVLDPHLLSSSPYESYREGLGEIIRTALIFDKELFRLLLDNYNDVINRSKEAVSEMIFRAALCKASAAGKSKKCNRLLRAGYAVGHAISADSSAAIPFAEAALSGLYMETVIGEKLKIIEKKLSPDINKCLSQYGFRTVYIPESSNEFIARLEPGRRNKKDMVKLPFLKKIGRADLFDIKMSKFEERLRKLIASED